MAPVSDNRKNLTFDIVPIRIELLLLFVLTLLLLFVQLASEIGNNDIGIFTKLS